MNSKIVDIEYSFSCCHDNIDGMSYDKNNDDIIGKLNYDYGLNKIKDHIHNSGKGYINEDFINESFVYTDNKYLDHRSIYIDISTFIGICAEAVHYYAKVTLRPIVMFADDSMKCNIYNSVNDESRITFDIWNYLDEEDIKEAEKRHDIIYRSSTGFRTKKKLIEGICEFINVFFNKEKFILIINDDTRALIKKADIKHIENKTGIKTFLK